MNKTQIILAILGLALLVGCGSGEENKDEPFKLKNHQNTDLTTSKSGKVLASEMVDLKNKGVGPVKSVKLEEQIDHSMVERGANVFKLKCTVCHRPEKKFIGPATVNILERRTPEWVMNMLLNPEEMLKKDPIAKALLDEYYGTPMINQRLTHEEARSVLEYYRTLD